MKPKSLSASAAHVFDLCPARYGAESFARTPNSNNPAAALGTACHDALERFCLSGEMVDPAAELASLIKYFDVAYDKLFGADISRKDEGRELLAKWYKRTHPIEHKIISAEVKESFPIKVQWNGQEVITPFNYIWDRCDELPDLAIDVVDYKTIAIPLNAEQMKEKLQVRAYALAAMVKFPNAPRIWVTYDMLRHGDPLGVAFTRDECIDTYRYLQNLLLRILDTDVNKLPEQVNEECRWCIRKQVCKALRKHADVGGIHGITDVEVAADRRMKMDNVRNALNAAIDELDGMLMAHMKKEDVIEEVVGTTKIVVTARGRRDVDPERVKIHVPENVWSDYAGTKLTMGDFDKLLKDERLTDEQRSSIKKLVTKTFGAPKIKTEPIKGEPE